MNKRKLDSLLWESIPFENFIIGGHVGIVQENLDDVFWDDVDELCVSRDDEYNISISCVRYLNQCKERKQKPVVQKQEVALGSTMPEGRLELKIFDDYTVTFAPMYCTGYASKLDKTEYKLFCYHIEGKYAKRESSVLKEWILNGSEGGLCLCGNSMFEYRVEGSVFGKYGDIAFPQKESLEEVCSGSFIHIKFKDTAFDVHFVGDSYGPSWSTNLSITVYNIVAPTPAW